MRGTVKRDEGGWSYRCGHELGCGDAPFDAGSRFASLGWPSKETATARGEQHEYEHAEGAPMQPLHEFRAERKVDV